MIIDKEDTLRDFARLLAVTTTHMFYNKIFDHKVVTSVDEKPSSANRGKICVFRFCENSLN